MPRLARFKDEAGRPIWINVHRVLAISETEEGLVRLQFGATAFVVVDAPIADVIEAVDAP